MWVKQELDRATIAYDALREGWFFTARHRNELAALDQSLREHRANAFDHPRAEVLLDSGDGGEPSWPTAAWMFCS